MREYLPPPMTEPDKKVLLWSASMLLRFGVAVLGFAFMGSIYLVATSDSDRGECGVVAPPRCGNTLDMSRLPGLEARLGTKADPLRGEKLFKGHCASCHRPDADMTGPAPRGVLDRAPQPALEWVHAFVRKEDSLITAKDPYALALQERWKGASAWQHRSDFTRQDVCDVLAFVELY